VRYPEPSACRLVIIGRGRLLADTSMDAFTRSNARRDVLVRSPQAGELAVLLAARGAAVTPEADSSLAVAGMDAPAIADLAAARGIPVYGLTERHASLEQAFMDITSGSVDYRASVPVPERTPIP